MNILLALLLVLQDETAEQAYARIEKALAQAKTLTVDCTSSLTLGDQKLATEGSVLFGEGNRHRIVYKAEVGAVKQASSTSDGRQVRQVPANPASRQPVWEAPATLNDDLKIGLLRRGCFELHRLASAIQDYHVKPGEKLVVSGLKYGEGKDGARPLLFTLQEGSGKAEVQLWFDAKTALPQKRVMTVQDPRGQTAGIVTELYKTFAINREIPESAFKLPE